MSTEKPIDMEQYTQHYKNIREGLNRAVKAGVFDMRENYALFISCSAMDDLFKYVDAMQKRMSHLMTHSELIKQAENLPQQQIKQI